LLTSCVDVVVVIDNNGLLQLTTIFVQQDRLISAKNPKKICAISFNFRIRALSTNHLLFIIIIMASPSSSSSSLLPHVTLEFAMDILHRALLGESGALNFLNRTSSIYLLDATDPTQPKTYGCWNFINQAMNELERFESKHMTNHNNNSMAASEVTVPLVQLLATFSQRVAQRSPSIDQALVATCIHNASQLYHHHNNNNHNNNTTNNNNLYSKSLSQEAQALIQANHDLREIVMGRIAAMVFDPSYHHHVGRLYHHRQPESAFSNPMAMESFCAVLAANAVSSGPNAMNHFVADWIVPSVSSLPPFAVVCVTLHVAQEAMRTPSAPAGSRDRIRRLVPLIIAQVVGPILANAILEPTTETTTPAAAATTTTSGTTTRRRNNDHANKEHALKHRIASTALRALERWCLVTGLSLGQVKSICTNVKVRV
jgi:hypothetical protein